MGVAAETIMRAMEGIAPAALAEPWDNVGLLAGHPDQRIKGVLLALDVTLEVVEEAGQKDCQMIIAHHPIFFGGIKSLREDHPEGMLACAILREGIAVFVAHTNLDRAPGGLCDCLAHTLGLIDPVGEGYVKVGGWSGGESGALLAHARQTLHAPHARLFGNPDGKADRVAVVSGSGMEYWRDALELGAQVLITGDVRHHDALDALAAGLGVIDAGHLPTEHLCVDLLAKGLQNALYSVQYPLRIEKSGVDVYTPRRTK